MWDHLPVRNLMMMQRLAALKTIDRQITVDWENGYGKDVDLLLERRHSLVEAMRAEGSSVKTF
jgi:hypothetical protein